MRTQLFSSVKKTLTILLAVCFLMSVTVAAVGAVPGDDKNRNDGPKGNHPNDYKGYSIKESKHMSHGNEHDHHHGHWVWVWDRGHWEWEGSNHHGHWVWVWDRGHWEWKGSRR